MQEKIFTILQIIESPSALTREQGQKIYDAIIPLLQKNIKIILDFKDIESIITPFLNVAIGKLYKDYSSEQLQHLLTLKNIPTGTASKFQIVIDNAKEYYSNKEQFDQAVKEVIDE